MPYLSYEEYKNLDFVKIEEDEFNRLLKKASDVLDNVTRDFYRHNDLNLDFSFRQEQFKKALASQIEYFHEMGFTNSHGLNEPNHVQIGRTSQSSGSRHSGNQKEQKNKPTSDDVYMYLSGTGLLYRGLGGRS